MGIRGRFAPTPSGRMHLGNLLAALLAWLDARSGGGELVLRIEDLDTQRTSRLFAAQLLDDLRWLGLDWDQGGLEPDYRQSRRTACYEEAFRLLEERGLIYPCYCSRTERMAASAPHREDGAVVYSGKCFRLTAAERAELEGQGRRPAWRVRCPDLSVTVEDGNCGTYTENLARDCGDFIVRRSDGVFAYQLAVVVDDALMGVNHVVRGRDLLCSAPRQAWLHEVLGYPPPRFFHTPLLLAPDGRRLAKRDHDLDMGALRERYSPGELTGLLAWYAGLVDRPEKVTAAELVPLFSWAKVPKNDVVVGCP
ncbi:MAG: tRNA glutamyl-Q(34) synthetase GluQRS [Oscillospiraceae bacterium]|jgi:glutamyl-tRNA synthetase|nr:tRNA glutamyl-Q(34) synthetase GluQRS [Oscillospiraceae bacterium]